MSTRLRNIEGAIRRLEVSERATLREREKVMARLSSGSKGAVRNSVRLEALTSALRSIKKQLVRTRVQQALLTNRIVEKAFGGGILERESVAADGGPETVDGGDAPPDGGPETVDGEGVQV